MASGATPDGEHTRLFVSQRPPLVLVLSEALPARLVPECGSEGTLLPSAPASLSFLQDQPTPHIQSSVTVEAARQGSSWSGWNQQEQTATGVSFRRDQNYQQQQHQHQLLLASSPTKG
ncbi:uncharacterized protein LOC126983575 isoform X2 [Eriocheir sinensis]|uniref:uncharacterized protein LOC126983575 isoform X2 n=1 Tax=Eriocheir sinensis TaxID=95602 RepID=UPI0021CA1460|nr:uncharacterized protein LOC126983575 isoform X2 [Eriocheir sinensis]